MTITPAREGLVTLDYIGVAIYLLVTVAIIAWSYRRKADTEDFFLGNRRMPWLAVGMSLLATLLSTNSYLGVPGEIIKNGVAMFAGYLAVPLSMGVVLLVWVPFFMRLKLTSAYEYLERRFDYRVRLLAGILFFGLRLGWISLVTYTASMALSRMTGVPLTTVILLVGIAATIYTCVGGIRAVIWNDVLQFVMLFGGTFVTIGYVMWATGAGPTQWWTSISSVATHKTSPPIFSWDITVRMTVVTAMVHTFFWTICTHGSDQVVLQRYFSTESLGAARRSYIVNAISDISVGLLLALSGLALHYFYLQEGAVLPDGLSVDGRADEVLPYFFAHQLPAGFGGLILAGFLCDAMQTLVSGVNSITAVATQDVFKRLFPGGKRLMKEMSLARLVTVAMGLLVTGLAFFVAQHVEHSGRNIVDLMPRMFNLFLGPLASVFLIGMFLPRCTARSTIAAVAVGLLVAVVWSWWGEIPAVCSYLGLHDTADWLVEILGRDEQGKPKTPTITLTIAIPYLTSFLLAALCGMLFDKGGEHPGRRYTWLAVMRRASENTEPTP
ncbi:MAG: sodium/solute symporter [Pirellulales bacterium]